MNRLASSLLVLSLLAAGCAPHAAEPPGPVTVHGTVRSASGQPLALAHVHLQPKGAGEAREVVLGADGQYQVEVPADGFYELEFAAVDHKPVEFPVVTSPGAKTVELSVTLASNAYRDTIEDPKVVVVGDGDETSSYAMDPRDDGTWGYVVETTAETVAYQLARVAANGHTINGQQASEYRYDGGGDYFSIVPVTDGRAEIVFDPAQAPAAGEGDLPAFASSDPTMSSVAEWGRRVADLRKKVREEKSDAAEAFAPLRQEVAGVLDDAAKPPALRGYLAAVLLTLPGETGEAEVAKVLELLPATSPQWSVAQWYVDTLDPETHGDYLAALAEGNPVREVRGIALAALAGEARRAGDAEAWRGYWTRLQEVAGDDAGNLEYYVESLDPAASIQPGKPVPAFEVALLDGSAKVTNASFTGHYVLLDFWATWCGPCVAELPNMSKAYERFGGGGDGQVQFLSLSFDESADDIAPFRADRFAMPWLHTFVEKGFKSDLAKSFEVEGIPKPILMGPEGEIVAVDDALRGEALNETLESALAGKV